MHLTPARTGCGPDGASRRIQLGRRLGGPGSPVWRRWDRQPEDNAPRDRAFDHRTASRSKQPTVDFPTEDGVVHAVRGVSFTLEPGEVLAVVGESGSGKSVSSLAIMGLLGKTARVGGSVKYRGVELIGMKPRYLARMRGQELAMVFQDPMTSLNPVYRVGWQLAEAIRAHHKIRVFLEGGARCEWNCSGWSGSPIPNSGPAAIRMSSGRDLRQRAVIAMAVANDPDI